MIEARGIVLDSNDPDFRQVFADTWGNCSSYYPADQNCKTMARVHCDWEINGSYDKGDVRNCVMQAPTDPPLPGVGVHDHGQQVSSIIADRTEASRIVHVSTAARDDQYYESDRSAALRWIEENRSQFGIGVVNRSGGNVTLGPGGCPDLDPSNDPDSEHVLIQSLVCSGVAYINAAGNLGHDDRIADQARPGNVISAAHTWGAGGTHCLDPQADRGDRLNLVADDVPTLNGDNPGGSSWAAPRISAMAANLLYRSLDRGFLLPGNRPIDTHGRVLEGLYRANNGNPQITERGFINPEGLHECQPFPDDASYLYGSGSATDAYVRSNQPEGDGLPGPSDYGKPSACLGGTPPPVVDLHVHDIEVDFLGCWAGSPQFIFQWDASGDPEADRYTADFSYDGSNWVQLHEGTEGVTNYSPQADTSSQLRFRACNGASPCSDYEFWPVPGTSCGGGSMQ